MKRSAADRIAETEKKNADFILTAVKSRELLNKISARLDDHYNANPENIKWTDLDEAQHVLSQLNDIAEFLNIK